MQIAVWNVNKLRRHSGNPDFKKFCSSYDIVCLIETWAKNKEDYSDLFETHEPFSSVRSAQNHYSGGIIVYVKKEMVHGCERIFENFDDCVVLKMNKNVFSLERDLILGAVYISPEGSTVYDSCEKGGIGLLEEKISKIIDSYDNVDMMLAGDFNSRTGELDDFIIDDSPDFIPELSENPSYDVDDFDIPRASMDKEVNKFGHDLISFCQSYGMHILNGRVSGDKNGNITCVANGGRSVVDYMLVNTRLYNLIQHFEVIVRIESDHFPVICKVDCAFDENLRSKTVTPTSSATNSATYKWFSKAYAKFEEKLSDEVTERKINEISDLLSADVDGGKIDTIASLFQNLFGYWCSNIKVSRQAGKDNTHVEWYDTECRNVKTEKFKFLNLFAKTGYQYFYEKFRFLRNKFKHLIRSKAKGYKTSLREQIENSVNDQKGFWALVKKISRNSFTSSRIPAKTWHEYFRKLLNRKPPNINQTFDTFVQNYIKSHDKDCFLCNSDEYLNYSDLAELNRDCSDSEVLEQIQNAPNGKAHGLDGILNEAIKAAKSRIVSSLTKFFNHILKSCLFPKTWRVGIIITLFKGGVRSIPGNYRGISLLSNLSKIFTGIINKRVVLWSETKGILSECQAGFRQAKSTIDQMFILKTMIDKFLFRKRGRFYCMFVDFAKAFDTVNRDYLIYSLVKSGMHGRVLKLIREVYSTVRATVRTEQCLTDFFECKLGVRQGCMLSPRLFIIFINELEIMLKRSEYRGISMGDAIEVFLLLYADDIVLVADTVLELQRKIRVLEKFCDKWGMEVNLTKTQVIVFRNGGKTSKSETFFYLAKKVKVVTYYRYLGLIFSSRNNWSKALLTLGAQAEKALKCIRTMFWKLGHPNVDVAFKIFDSRIVPILLYGSEIWGFESRNQIEKIHLRFCKFVLGVGQSANSAAVLGECGRLPLHIKYNKRFIKYWLKLLRSPQGSLLQTCYKMQTDLDAIYKRGWVTNLKKLVFSNGFGLVWITQGVGDEELFMKSVVLRLSDIAKQTWNSEIDSSPKLSTYREFKSLLNPEKYLYTVNNYFIRKQLTKFRISNHKLMVEEGRYRGIDFADRRCIYCDMNCIENECHFLLECPLYEEIRRKHLIFLNCDWHCQNHDKFVKIMSSQNKETLRNLALFVYKGFKLRAKTNVQS